MKKIIRIILANTVLLCLSMSTLCSQTIAEKIAGSSGPGDLNPELQKELQQVNLEISQKKRELAGLYGQVAHMHCMNAPEEDYGSLLQSINAIRDQIDVIENRWRLSVSEEVNPEQYALWHQPETTLGDIIIDYGSQNYVYLLSPELSSYRLSINSSVPIPRASWDDMLETILTQNGIGIKQLNPYLRQLYVLKEDLSPIVLITNKRSDLTMLPPTARICFVLTPDPSETRRIWLFLDKFINPNSTILQNIGREILIIAQVSEIRELLKLYDFAIENHGDREYKLIPLKRVDADEIAKVLAAIFDQLTHDSGEVRESERVKEPIKPKAGRGSNKSSMAENNSLQVITLKNIAPAVVLIGTQEEIKKAYNIIKEVESQIGGTKEQVVYVYHARHSPAGEIAGIIDKMYLLLLKTGAMTPMQAQIAMLAQQQQIQAQQQRNLANAIAGGAPPASPFQPPLPQMPQGPMGIVQPQPQPVPVPLPFNTPQFDPNSNVLNLTLPTPPPPPTANQIFSDGYYQEGQYVINPAPIGPFSPPRPRSREPERNNFIVNETTNSIMMVVEKDLLPQIKELISKIDVPKKMVQIEVMLFDKRVNNHDNIGLNLLRIGNCATNTHRTCFDYNDPDHLRRGITQFLISRKETDSGIPAFDLIYNFLIAQEDTTINAAPSVVTTNQVPALISIQEEISINTGQFLVDTATGAPVLKDAFVRAQFGITISVTPTISMADDSDCNDDEGDYVILENDLTFDNPVSRFNDRPDVIRRKVQNVVRVPDGQSVIIGGLRRRISQDTKQAIPFIGEVPGIGKLFSHTTMSDFDTEMFVVITPKIIVDPVQDFQRLKYDQVCKRPGDLPEFLCVVEEASRMENQRLLNGTMRLLFGRPPQRCLLENDRYGW